VIKDAATTAAFWSAIAATCAAVSSFLIFLVQRRNLLESVRPEIVLIGWSRYKRGNGDAAHEVIAFQTIKNVGRGPALGVYINLKGFGPERPTAVLSTKRLPILAAGESEESAGEIILWWKNVKENPQGKYLPLNIQIYCWDSRNMRHETLYHMLAIELGDRSAIADEIAPGVGLSLRKTVTRAVWSLKFQRTLARVPWVGKVFS